MHVPGGAAGRQRQLPCRRPAATAIGSCVGTPLRSGSRPLLGALEVRPLVPTTSGSCGAPSCSACADARASASSRTAPRGPNDALCGPIGPMPSNRQRRRTATAAATSSGDASADAVGSADADAQAGAGADAGTNAAAATATSAPPPQRGPGPAPGPLPYSSETARALRAAKDQAARQGLMFAGPDQLVLGVLAAGGGGDSSTATAAAALEAALGGGDADSVREWLNEQEGLVAPLAYGSGGGVGAVGSGGLRGSDVELTAAAREALRRAARGAEAMGCRSVGTYHLLLVALFGGSAVWGPAAAAAAAADAEAAAAAADAEAVAAEEAGEAGEVDGAEASASSRGDGGSNGGGDGAGGDGGGGGGGGGGGLLPALLRAVGADAGALQQQLLALAQRDGETPPALAPSAAFQGVVSTLTAAYRRQADKPWAERRDDEDFRRGLPHGPGAVTAAAPGSWAAGAGGRGGGGAGQQDDYDDVYE